MSPRRHSVRGLPSTRPPPSGGHEAKTKTSLNAPLCTGGSEQTSRRAAASRGAVAPAAATRGRAGDARHRALLRANASPDARAPYAFLDRERCQWQCNLSRDSELGEGAGARHGQGSSDLRWVGCWPPACARMRVRGRSRWVASGRAVALFKATGGLSRAFGPDCTWEGTARNLTCVPVRGGFGRVGSHLRSAGWPRALLTGASRACGIFRGFSRRAAGAVPEKRRRVVGAS